MLIRRSLLVAALCGGLVSTGTAPLPAQQTGTVERPDSEQPPGAMPWTKDFLEARRRALRAGVPIFVYSTKTH